MKPVAIRSFARAEPPVVTRLASLGVATVHEALGRSGLLAPAIRPIQRGARVAGTALTVLAHPGDNWMLHVALDLAEHGDILCVGVSAENRDGMFGDLLAEFAMARGVRALVTDAGVRDTAELRQMGFPVWARAVSAKGTVKETLGSVNIPIVCGGQLIRPGDAVVADDDGIVIVPRMQAASVAAAAEARQAEEATKRQELRSGASSLDLYGLRERLSTEGLGYIETLEEWERGPPGRSFG